MQDNLMISKTKNIWHSYSTLFALLRVLLGILVEDLTLFPTHNNTCTALYTSIVAILFIPGKEIRRLMETI